MSLSVIPNRTINEAPIESKIESVEISNKEVNGAKEFCEIAFSLLLPSTLMTRSDNFAIVLLRFPVNKAIFPPIFFASTAMALGEVVSPLPLTSAYQNQ